MLKETSGEFSMTVVVIVGAIIVVGLLSAMGPYMGNYIKKTWDRWTDSGNAAAQNAAKPLT